MAVAQENKIAAPPSSMGCLSSAPSGCGEPCSVPSLGKGRPDGVARNTGFFITKAFSLLEKASLWQLLRPRTNLVSIHCVLDVCERPRKEQTRQKPVCRRFSREWHFETRAVLTSLHVQPFRQLTLAWVRARAWSATGVSVRPESHSPSSQLLDTLFESPPSRKHPSVLSQRPALR